MDTLVLILVGLVVGAIIAFLLLRLMAKKAPLESVETKTIFERVSAIGRLVALEVCAKEIATSTKGWGWLPPLILSQAKLAMIFHFEKQYSIDLTRLRRSDIEQVEEGSFRVKLPPIEGALRLTDVTPYDIQAGRMLGLLDIIQVDAPTQKELMQRAQSQAAELYEMNNPKYEAEARRSVEKQLESLLSLFDVRIELIWPERPMENREVEVAAPAGA